MSSLAIKDIDFFEPEKQIKTPRNRNEESMKKVFKVCFDELWAYLDMRNAFNAASSDYDIQSTIYFRLFKNEMPRFSLWRQVFLEVAKNSERKKELPIFKAFKSKYNELIRFTESSIIEKRYSKQPKSSDDFKVEFKINAIQICNIYRCHHNMGLIESYLSNKNIVLNIPKKLNRFERHNYLSNNFPEMLANLNLKIGVENEN